MSAMNKENPTNHESKYDYDENSRREEKKDNQYSESKNDDFVMKNKDLNATVGSDDTLSRGNLISEFLRNQKLNMKDMTQEEFLMRYEAYVREIESNRNNGTNGAVAGNGVGSGAAGDRLSKSQATKPKSADKDKQRNSFYNSEGNFKTIVLKFTTLSEGCTEAPSFTVDRKGAKIGREKTNDICVPSDTRLSAEAHSTIEYHRGAFYIIDGGFPFSASVRIGIGNNGGNQKKWWVDKEARFCAGNSIFLSKGVNAEGFLEVFVMEGPLKGETVKISKKGATLGRSSENGVCVPDRELSRKHSKVEYDEKNDRFFVMDLGSTNGTYIQLVGPYGGRYKLHLNDHILVGRTGFSINRFDYGLSEEMGYRQSMEDACTIVQHLNIAPLCVPDLSPQSFFGVFDGHGGIHASHYLAQHLHVNVAHGLLDSSNDIFHILDEIAPESVYESQAGALQSLDKIVMEGLKKSFLKTDQDFINGSTNPQNGSTATTALILGRRLYCANVGDSRTMLCRNFEPLLLTQDHKPTREDEAKRIREAGGFVINNRVMGELAVSRAFGDVDFKRGIQSIIEQEGGNQDNSDAKKEEMSNWDKPLIVAEPDVQAVTVTDQDQFLLLACDGLFDVYTPEEIVTFVKNGMEKHGDTQRCCQHLTHDAIRKRNSRDNVSVILIILNKWY